MVVFIWAVEWVVAVVSLMAATLIGFCVGIELAG